MAMPRDLRTKTEANTSCTARLLFHDAALQRVPQVIEHPNLNAKQPTETSQVHVATHERNHKLV